MSNSYCIDILNNILSISEKINFSVLNDNLGVAIEFIIERNEMFEKVIKLDLTSLSADEKQQIKQLIEKIESNDETGNNIILNEKRRVSTELSRLKTNKFAMSKYTENKL